jgi:glycosyltransferase involved in cell wall biosynthesis
MSKLAIVIPAYKNTYFDQALLSIANQTNKDFTLYIGDDCSPENLYSIIEKYIDRISISYKHFDENIGGKDLVAQWERCIDLVGHEEWIWLFSDDDFMDTNCVEAFYQAINENNDYDLYHLKVKKVDEYSNPTFTQFIPYPEILTVEDYLLGVLQPGYFSTAVEFIFRKSFYFDNGRFQNFDLAWCSDNATVIKLGKRKGIRTIENSLVYWRLSLLNISSIEKDKNIVIRKMNAQLEFANWLYERLKNGEIKIEDSKLRRELESWFMRSIQSRIEILNFKLVVSLMKKFNNIVGNKESMIQNVLFLAIYKLFRNFRGILKKIIFWRFLKLQKQKLQNLRFLL